MQQQGMSQLFGKDLTVLEDQMNHEALAAKKSAYMAQHLTDPALKSVANALAQHHRTQFANLFNYLNSH